jgi:hypothetical protein
MRMLTTLQISKNSVIPQNFLFAPWRKEIYAESDLVSIGKKPNRIPYKRAFLRAKMRVLRNDEFFKRRQVEIRKFLFLSILCLGIGFWAIPCRADTDYQCLNLCAGNGQPAAACLSKCGYDSPAIPSANQRAKPPAQLPGQNHRIVNAPLAANDTLLLHKPKPHTDSAPKNYICMANCLQQTKLYAMCEQKCTPSLQKLKKTSQYP